MFRVVLTLSLFAAALSAPVESDTEFCNGQTECPQDCGFVSRNEKCVFCMCGPGPLAPGEQVVGAGEPCPPGTYPGRNTGLTQVCVPGGPEPVPEPTPEPEPGCPHGPGFIDECNNDCNCVDGRFYGCTKKLCKPGEKPETPMSCSGSDGLPKRSGQRVFCHEGIVKVQSTDAKCLMGAVFKDQEDCNTCTCPTNRGVAACTLMLCLPPTVTKAGCPYGPGFIDECNNDCSCVDGRIYGCTRKACKPGEKTEVPKSCSSSENLPERPGQRVFCDEGIVKLQKQEPGCQHGPGFIDECNNDCECVDGRFYGCTRKACKPGEKAEVPMTCSSSENLPKRPGQKVFCDEGIVKLQSPECPHGDEFIDECGNDCRCLKDGYACTLKACQPGQMSMKPMACKGSSGLPERKGRRVFCHEKIVKLQDKDATCLPGAAFMNECNQCFCTDTGASGCTFKACLGKETASTVTCEDGLPECPQDCGQAYNPVKDCFDCPCGVGKPGDITVQIDEPCPAGTTVREAGAFIKACGPVDKCPQGLEFIDECGNDCRCQNDGYACTLKACQPGQTPKKPMACDGAGGLPERPTRRVFCHENIVKLQDKAEVCLPGALFKNDCNECFCGDKGMSGCTLKACLGKESDTGCPHGADFIDECDNDCSCVDNKFYGCTKKACKPGQTSQKPMSCKGAAGLPERTGRRVFCQEGIVKTQDKDATCLPGAVFMNECNQCFCTDTGTSGCTFKACLSKRSDTGCPHGADFIDECDNDCSCVDNKFYGCTRKACKPGQTSQKPMSCKGSTGLPERTGRRVFCHEGIVKTQDKDATCLPGAAFMNECNQCFCTDTGTSGCTFKACLDTGCPHGADFIDECDNDCSCVDNNFYGCTRKACKPGQTSQKPMSCKEAAGLPERTGRRVFCHEGIVKTQEKDATCLPGAAFMNECNQCFCTDTGASGCTFKACLGKEADTGCPHGADFIDECDNDCSCVDNKFYGCTRKACKSGETSQKPMSCKGAAGLPERTGRRVFCHEGIVKTQDKDAKCLPGSAFMMECNQCTCNGACTLKACLK